ncbi:MAG TPA: YggT family protein [Pyrinomonadaceae bacterium]|nr:YggT family protein [Pyrinomonadaceae bacterium]HMP64580.1 YggT family protein [Pyrinomonadaceae bacterium]
MLSETVYPILRLVLWGAFFVLLVFLLLRLAFNYADPNPFGAVGRFGFKIRKSTERWVYPAARFLAGFRVDVRLAPLLVIFVSLVLTYFTSQIISNAFFVIDGLSDSVSAGNVNATVGFVLYGLLSLLIILIVVRVVSQWFVSSSNSFFAFARKVTDPIMIPVQKRIPTVGMFDVSAMIVLIVILILQAIVMNVFVR